MKRLIVLYGSQTFTAQEIAEKIWRTTKAFGFRGPVQAMDDYPISKLIQEQYAIFVCATAGQGEEPDNMKRFWKFLLKKNLPSHSLSNLKYGVLALGDSSFAKFNFVGKKMHKRLAQLGGTPLINVGLCDYQHDLGHDAVMVPWLKEFWMKLQDYYPEINISESIPDTFIPRWKVTLLKDQSDVMSRILQDKIEKVNQIISSDRLPLNGLTSDIYFGKPLKNLYMEPKSIEVLSNVRTTAEDHFQDVRLMQFEMSDDSKFTYSPGDVFNLRPRNSEESIRDLFNIFKDHDLDILPEYRLLVESCHEDMPVPEFLQEPLTMYEIAEQYWDLNFIPSRYVFSLLALVSEDKLEREKCIEFCSPEGQEDMLNYTKRPRRTILEVLKDFHRSTSKLKIDTLFELFSPIKPRSFSLASSCKQSDGRAMDILVAVVKYYSTLKSPRLGLGSNWLKTLGPGDRIYGWFKNGTFVFPSDKTTPCILIGPGTGFAPFRSLILEREALGTASKETLIMFFGCRREAKDFHCRDELMRLEREGKLTLFTAFSRDQENKVYVQHRIAEQNNFLWKLVNDKNAMIFISGNAKNMPDNVKDAFAEDVFHKAGGMTLEDARKRVQEMENKEILQIETW